MELFSVIIAYVIFLVAWESKTFLENRYLLLIEISCFFFGTLDLLHTLSYERMEIFPVAYIEGVGLTAFKVISRLSADVLSIFTIFSAIVFSEKLHV
ncbi:MULTISPECIES: MASE3 domain-containing protein [unclassified Methanosarcina]|uniref:MASE3 domain-containing protein n=1 Tax=Methanosarcina sp. 2.H.T.1A.8 TaxID=1483598 RepID=UPI001F1A6875